jgi:hypothetical protein
MIDEGLLEIARGGGFAGVVNAACTAPAKIESRTVTGNAWRMPP